jgi:tetratricopeptide (TPR) repeat protein
LDWQRLHEYADSSLISIPISEPESAAGLYVYGLACLNKHRDRDAERAFDKILAGELGIVEAKWGKAEVLRRRHNLAESEKILKEAIAANPEFSPAYISLAYIKYIRMDFKGCIRLALKVIRQGRYNVDISNYARAHLLYAEAKGMHAYYSGPLAKLFDGVSIMPNLKKAEGLQPYSAAVMYGLGSFYLLAPGIIGVDIDKAKAYMEKAIGIDPLFADAYVRLAQVYRLRGDEGNYAKYLDKALGIDPQNELALDIKSGRCLFICVEKPKPLKARD